LRRYCYQRCNDTEGEPRNGALNESFSIYQLLKRYDNSDKKGDPIAFLKKFCLTSTGSIKNGHTQALQAGHKSFKPKATYKLIYYYTEGLSQTFDFSSRMLDVPNWMFGRTRVYHRSAVLTITLSIFPMYFSGNIIQILIRVRALTVTE
jgi:hypothetical protein